MAFCAENCTPDFSLYKKSSGQPVQNIIWSSTFESDSLFSVFHVPPFLSK